MQITYIDGSPKAHDSTSLFFLKSMEERLSNNTILWHHSTNITMTSLLKDMNKSQVLLIAFPLYADGIPSHLIDLMQKLEYDTNLKNNLTVYIIANCGFYEGKQNRLALEMFQIWTKKCGFKWGYGIGIGAGGMLQTAPVGKGPNTSIGKVFDKLAMDIEKCESRDNIFTNPDLPRFLYLRLGHLSWRREAKQNGLSARNLKDQIEI